MANTTKKRLIRRNLPINDTYKLISSFSKGKMSDGDCLTCDNCGMLIVNIAVIENSKKIKHYVGLDCASTLSGIQDSTELWHTEADFKEAKALRTKINKHLKKEGNKLSVEVNFFGKVWLDVEDDKGRRYVAESVTQDFLFSYLPDFKEKIINPQKIGFSPVAKVEDLSEPDFTGYSYNEPINPVHFTFHGFDIEVNPKKVENSSRHESCIVISENGVPLVTHTVAFPREIIERTCIQINKILFSRFINTGS